MIYIIIRGHECKTATTQDAFERDKKKGWRELSTAEIAAAGMLGYEQFVCPLNTVVHEDGSITFTPPPPPATEELYAQLRAARDAKLTATDKYLLPDYPISADSLAAIKAYRQTLRDLPGQDGAPWDGGGEATPWPELPSVE